MSAQDWQYSGLFFIILLSIIAVFEFTFSRLHWPQKNTRKAIHILVGLALVSASYFITSAIPILVLTGLFSLGNLIMIRRGLFGSMHAGTRSLGTFYYPLSIFIIAMFFWESQPLVFRTSALVLAVPDALAAIIGTRYGRRKFIVLDDKKSVAGTLTMFISSLIIIVAGFLHSGRFDMFTIVSYALMVTFSVVIAELVSINGSDNISIPLVASFLLVGYMQGDTEFQQRLLVGQLMAILVGSFSLRYKFLSKDGAASAFLLGSFIFGFGGIAGTIPILTFFILSSLLSKIGKRYKKQIENNYEKSSTRDAAQVLANGGIGGILVLALAITGWEWVYILYLVSIAIATADTWSTELGVFSKHRPRLISSFRKVLPGTSGAISITGTLAGLAGAAIIALSGLEFIQHYNPALVLAFVVFGGFIGNLFDSLFGATIQAKYFCPTCSKITEKKEHCGTESKYSSGYRVITNDKVNILAIFAGTLLVALLFWI